MELISGFFLIGVAVSVFGGVSANIFLSPAPFVDNICILPVLTAVRRGDLVVISHLRGKCVDRCIVVVNGSAIGFSYFGFKIGDVVEVNCSLNSYIEVYDFDKLLFFAII